MDRTFHHFLLFHLCLSLIFLACQIENQMMMRRRKRGRKSSGVKKQIRRRP
jgi:hypothetical protein